MEFFLDSDFGERLNRIKIAPPYYTRYLFEMMNLNIFNDVKSKNPLTLTSKLKILDRSRLLFKFQRNISALYCFLHGVTPKIHRK